MNGDAERRDVEVTIQQVSDEEFARLWNMPDGGYPCTGCGEGGFSEPGWCQACVDAANAKLRAWNVASRAASPDVQLEHED